MTRGLPNYSPLAIRPKIAIKEGAMKEKSIDKSLSSRSSFLHSRRSNQLVHLLDLDHSQVEELLEREIRVPRVQTTHNEVKAFKKTLAEIGFIR